MLKIRMFGHFEVSRHDTLIPDCVWRTGKSRELLKVLLTDPGRLFSHDELIETLWPGKPPKKADANLRGRMSELRRILEPEQMQRGQSRYITTNAYGYRFELTNAWLDTQAFSKLYERGRELEKQGELEQAVDIYEAAAKLYRGDYLVEDKHLDWSTLPRNRLARCYLDLIVHLVDGLHKLNRCTDVILYGERALELDPYHEGIYQRLIQCYADSGQLHAALETYQRCCRALGEVELAPSRELKQMVEFVKNTAK